jgi:hypothetical protein
MKLAMPLNTYTYLRALGWEGEYATNVKQRRYNLGVLT